MFTATAALIDQIGCADAERHRVHIPIITTTSSAFLVLGGSAVHLQAGKIWRLTPTFVHGACNVYGPARIHLVLDCYADATLDALRSGEHLPTSCARDLPETDTEELDGYTATARRLACLGYVQAAEEHLLRLFFYRRLPEGRAYDMVISLHRDRGDHTAVTTWSEHKKIVLSPHSLVVGVRAADYAAFTAAHDALIATRLGQRWHGAAADWTVLVFDDVEGRHPDLAPGSADTSGVVAAIAAMGQELTPCPVPELEPSATARGNWLHGWELIAQDPPDDLGAWERRRLASLVKTETVWRSHADGPTLVHGDIRPDNLLTTVNGTVAVVDWAHASRGAAWQDVADLVPYLVMAGHSPASAEIQLAGTGVWAAAGAEVLTSYAAAYAGYWTRMSRQPAPEGVPHLRAYQRRAAGAALAWVRHRCGVG